MCITFGIEIEMRVCVTIENEIDILLDIREKMMLIWRYITVGNLPTP